ncbi:hypothetical protein PV326_002935 [Microctonus aethiopoides]|nr:hypothetical protein PV326_002935 [Microctonus aethiopoides]
MRFLSCSQCFNGIEEARSNVMLNPSCDPLLITKRPTAKMPAENSHRRISIPMECRSTEGRVIRLPKMLRAALSAASWRSKRHPSEARNYQKKSRKLLMRKKIQKRNNFRKKDRTLKFSELLPLDNDNDTSNNEILNVDDGIFESGYEDDKVMEKCKGGLGLEYEYYQQLETLKFLLSPSPHTFTNSLNSFSKLNSIDFRRMNTIAIPDESSWNIDKFHRTKFDITEREMRAKYFLDSVDRVIRENRKIEEAMMMSIFQRHPIHNSDINKPCLNRVTEPITKQNKTKTVRFKMDEDKTIECINMKKAHMKNILLFDENLYRNISCEVNRKHIELFAKNDREQLRRMNSMVNISHQPHELSHVENIESDVKVVETTNSKVALPINSVNRVTTLRIKVDERDNSSSTIADNIVANLANNVNKKTTYNTPSTKIISLDVIEPNDDTHHNFDFPNQNGGSLSYVKNSDNSGKLDGTTKSE